MKFARGIPIGIVGIPLLPAAAGAMYSFYFNVSLLSVVPGTLYITAVILLVLSLLFFRDPERDICSEEVCCPADGTVRDVSRTDSGWLVSIFMNVHNVHVNRSPAKGRIISVEHVHGSHMPAFNKESERNERVIYNIETEHGTLRMTQIAGIVARRIMPYVGPGETIGKGERIGLIRFGSRVDTVLPAGMEILVRKGDRVLAGSTPMAATNKRRRQDE